MNIGDRIKQKRLENNLTLEELGNILGLNKSTLSKYESGLISIPSDKIEKLANILNTTPAFLMGWIEIRDNSNSNVNLSENSGKIGNITYNTTTNNNNRCCEELNPAEQNIDDTIKLQQQDKIIQNEILSIIKELSITSKELLIVLKEIKNIIEK